MDTATLLDPTTVRVELGERSYDIFIGDGLVPRAGELLAPFLKQKRAFILSDETVWALHGKALVAGLEQGGVQAFEKVLPAGESTKNWAQLGDVLDWLLAQGAGRDDVLIAFGGGVIGDLTGLGRIADEAWHAIRANPDHAVGAS